MSSVQRDATPREKEPEAELRLRFRTHPPAPARRRSSCPRMRCTRCARKRTAGLPDALTSAPLTITSSCSVRSQPDANLTKRVAHDRRALYLRQLEAANTGW